MNRRSLILCGALIASGTRVSAFAQSDASPEVQLALVDILPEAEAIAPGWTLVQTIEPNVQGTAFAEVVRAAYGGPAGEHASITLFRHANDRRSILQAWEEAQDEYSNAFNFSVDLDNPWASQGELNSGVPPEGFADAVRAEGVDKWFAYQSGIGLYAIEPDLIVLVVVVGPVGDDRKIVLSAAADHIARLVLERLA